MVNRLFQMVYLLLEKPQMTAKELAEVLEVSERTIYRDIDKLTIAGITIYTSQGKNGGISLLPDYVLDKAILTKEEKERIAEALNVLNEVVFSEKQESVSKLNAFWGEQYQDWIEVEFSSWGNNEEDSRVFAQIKEAVLKHRYMKIAYAGSQGTLTEREIKPLKLCLKDQAWYLYAYCCLREDYRFFKLRRISELAILEKDFKPEPVGKVLPQGSRAYAGHAPAVRVVLEINCDMTFRAYEELTDVTVTDSGNLLCTVEVTDIYWFVSYVLSYGSHIRILEPPDIKEKVRQEIEKMSAVY